QPEFLLSGKGGVGLGGYILLVPSLLRTAPAAGLRSLSCTADHGYLAQPGGVQYVRFLGQIGLRYAATGRPRLQPDLHILERALVARQLSAAEWDLLRARHPARRLAGLARREGGAPLAGGRIGWYRRATLGPASVFELLRRLVFNSGHGDRRGTPAHY